MSNRSILLKSLAFVILSTTQLFSQITAVKVVGSDFDDQILSSSVSGQRLLHTGFVNSPSLSSEDISIIVTDRSGSPLAGRHLGGDDDDWGIGFFQTEHGYVLGGRTFSFGAGHRDYFFASLDAQGQLRSFKTYGGPGDDRMTAMIQTSDGGFLMTGGTYNGTLGSCEIPLIKVNAKGEVQWTRVFGSWNFEIAYSVQEGPDGSFFVLGYSNSFTTGGNNSDLILIKTDNFGELIWARTFGDAGDDFVTAPQALFIDNDGSSYIAAFSESFSLGGRDAYILRVDPAGQLVWAFAFGGELDDITRSIIVTPNQKLHIVGSTYSFQSSSRNAWTIQLDLDGRLEHSIGYGGASEDFFTQSMAHGANSILALGYTQSYSNGVQDLYFVKLDESGHSACDSYDINPEQLNTQTVTQDVTFPVTTSLLGIRDIPLESIHNYPLDLHEDIICVDTRAASQEKPEQLPAEFTLGSITPNPFNPETQIKFSIPGGGQIQIIIFDATGRQVRNLVQRSFPGGTHSVIWDGNADSGKRCSSGMYYCQINWDDQQISQKLTLLK